jgi:hypothetical protein
MATWEEIRTYMRARYRLLEEDDDHVALLFGFDDNRRHSITIKQFDAMDRQWLLFEARVCRKELMETERALKLNGKSVIGYLALDRDGFYVMRHTALLSTLDPDELVVPMHVLVKVADKLEEELTGSDIW